MPNPVILRRTVVNSGISLPPNYNAALAALNDWVTRVQGQGSDVTISGTQTAVFNFILGLMDDGVWSKIVRMNIYAGDDINALKAPLKDGGGTSVNDTLNNFVGGDYAQNTGLTGSTSGGPKYLDSSLSWDDASTGDTNIHMGIYARTASDSGLSCQSGTGSTFTAILPADAGTGVAAFYLDSTTQVLQVADAGIGFYIGTVTASNSAVIYKNGTSIVSTATGMGNRKALPIIYHAQHYNGSVSSPTGRTLEMYSIGTGLTSTNAANFATRYSTLRSALGR